MANKATIERLTEQHRITSRFKGGALAQLVAIATSDLPLYHDAEFLRAEILRVYNECQENIENARKEAIAA